MKNKGIWLVIMSIMVAGIVITISINIFVKNQKVLESPAVEAAMDVKETQAEAGLFEAGRTGAGVSGETSEEAEPKKITEGEALPQMADVQAAPMEAPIETVAETLDQVETVRSPLETEIATTTSLTITENNDGKMGAKTSLIISGPDYRTRLDELGVQIQKIREEGTESTTYSLKAAAENELKLWDSELNSIYNDLLNYMSDEEDLKLIEEEREWMKARDAAAVEAAKKSAGGTLEGLEYTASLAESTKQRAYELADMYIEITK